VLTIHTRRHDGSLMHVRWFCDQCEARELADRDLPPISVGVCVSLSLGRLMREELRHGEDALPAWCDGGCEEARI
jgi:hypothetical protein